MRGKPKLVKLIDNTGNLKSRNWYIQYYERGRSCRQTTGCEIGAGDHAAQIFFSTWILERERPITKSLDQLTLVQALTDYYDEHAQYTATATNARHHETRLNKHFADHTVADLTPSVMRAYVRRCETEGRSNGTTRRELAHLSAALNHAVAEQRIPYAPKIVLPPPPPPRERILTQREIQALMGASETPHVRQFIQIMLGTGQRPGAVERLRWDQIDWKERTIHFDRTVRVKTNKRIRPVPLTDALFRLLKKMHRDRGETGYVLEYVVTRKNGERLVRPAGCVRRAFDRTAARAGLEDVSRYTLRHTFGNLLDEQGVDDRSISELMGHTNVLTTRKHYLKTNMRKLRMAMESAQKVRKSKAAR